MSIESTSLGCISDKTDQSWLELTVEGIEAEEGLVALTISCRWRVQSFNDVTWVLLIVESDNMSFMKLFVVDHSHELNISVLDGHGGQDKLMAAGLLQIDHLDAATISDEYESVI